MSLYEIKMSANFVYIKYTVCAIGQILFVLYNFSNIGIVVFYALREKK